MVDESIHASCRRQTCITDDKSYEGSGFGEINVAGAGDPDQCSSACGGRYEETHSIWHEGQVGKAALTSENGCSPRKRQTAAGCRRLNTEGHRIGPWVCQAGRKSTKWKGRKMEVARTVDPGLGSELQVLLGGSGDA